MESPYLIKTSYEFHLFHEFITGTKYTDSLNNYVKRTESPNDELIRRTDNREEWKAMIAYSAEPEI